MIDGVMFEMHYKFSPLASASPCQDAENDAFAGQKSRLETAANFYLIIHSEGNGIDGEVEHTVLYRKILPEILASHFFQISSPSKPALSAISPSPLE